MEPRELLFDIALDHLSLGRSHLLGVLRGTGGDIDEAASHLGEAVNGLRRAGDQAYLPLGLLARAALHTHARALDLARKDLDEVHRIATRCGFRLHEADTHLGYARLALAEGNPATALDPLSAARKIIDETGYHRRDRELAELKAEVDAMARAAPPPSAPPAQVPSPQPAPAPLVQQAPVTNPQPSPVTVTTPADHKGKVDFAILTIRDDEFQAVLDRFPPFTRAKGRRVYNLHRLDLPAGGTYLVAVLKCIEQGNAEALDAARDVLEELEPRWLLVVGIAGGIPSDGLTLGDVVVSTRIVDFSVEAVLQDKPSEYALMGGPVHKDAAAVLANLRALAGELGAWGSAASVGAPRPPVEVDDGEFYGDEAWQKKARAGLARQAARTEPIVTAGAIGSSDRLVKDTRILATFLLRAARQVLAVEMESAGVYRAATGRGVPLVAIRGLSDVVGFKRDPGWTAYACHTAAAFTRAFLCTRPIEPRSTGAAPPLQPLLDALANPALATEDAAQAESPDAAQAQVVTLAAASRAMARWPQTLPTGEWLDRPELGELLARLQQPEPRPLLLLGGPGSGKSAVLARLTGRLTEAGTVVLAIRADTLTRDIDRLGRLREWLQLPEAPATLLRRAAGRGRATLIVDQLDALADLCDAHTQRLDVLLRLVDEVDRTPRLGIVLSCRDFEFRHDQRFRSLRADHVTLSPLPQEVVASTIQRTSVDPRSLSPSLVEGLRAPQALTMFLRYMEGKTQAPAFGTYQQVLEGLWEERVIRRDGNMRRAEAIGAIAKHMAEEEELSAPFAAFARFSAEILDLEAADILRRDDPRCISFTHQTWFAFARARSFVLGEERLSEHVRLNGGSLFVRATVWAAMVNLRETHRKRYHKELCAMWAAADFRIHLRTLLVELLGAQPEPDEQEAALLLRELRHDGYLRRVILSAVAGSPGWFRNVTSNHLPVLMSGPNAAEVWWLLARALPFDRTQVLDLVEQYWVHEPSRATLTLSVLRSVERWDDRTLAMVLAVLRHGEAIGSQHRTVASMLVHDIAKEDPERALRIVRTVLDQSLARCRAKVPDSARSGPARWDDPVRKLVEHDHGFHCLIEIATKAPLAFMNDIWPWFVGALQHMANPGGDASTAYRSDHGLWTWTVNDSAPVYELPKAIEIAVVATARQYPEPFLKLLGQWQSSDILTVHNLLAQGLQELARTNAEAVVEYLLGDPRRLLLGNSEDAAATTVALIGAVGPYLDRERIAQLEAAILSSRRYSGRLEDDPRWRFQRQRYNRYHRMRLLTALQGSPFFSTASRTLIEQESRALTDLKGTDGVRFWSETRESPMRAAEMQQAADEHILNLFDELAQRPDEMGSADRVPWSGVLASRELALMTKEDPQRAIVLATALRPGVHELPAAHMLEALSQCGTPDRTQMLEDVVLLLEERGFSTPNYREQVAWALYNISKTSHLSERMLDMLQRWLKEDSSEAPVHSHEAERGREPLSVLLGHGGMSVLPHGNFPILLALTDACLRPQDAVRSARWASLLESHLSRREQPAVWMAMLKYLNYHPDDEALTALTDRLFERYPTVRDCVEGAHHIASLRRKADSEQLYRWLEELREGPWTRGAQAYGELLVLLSAQRSDLQWAVQRVDAYLQPDATTADRDQVRLGLAFIAVELWSEPEARPLCTGIILRLLPLAKGDVAKALMGVFGRRHALLADDATNQVLDTVLRHRRLLPAADVDGLASQLEGLCTLEPDRILALFNALLEEAERAPDAVPHLGSVARELIDISLTLQRLPGHRDTGLDLFERMLKLGLYGVHETLKELNVRPDAEPAPPRWR